MVEPVVFVIEAGEEGVGRGAEIEIRFRPVVDREAVDFRRRLEADAVQEEVRAGRCAADIAIGVRVLLVFVKIGVARVLGEGPAIVEVVLELVAEHLLRIAALVDIRLAVIGIPVDLAEGRVFDGSDIGQEAVADMDLIEALKQAEDGQAGCAIGRIGYLRKDETAQIFGIVRIVVAAGDLAGEAVANRSVIVQLVVQSKPVKALPLLLMPSSV